jgi:phage shock protein C
MGVCQGVGEKFDLPVFWVRVAVVVLFFASGLWPVIGLYLLAAFTMKPEPVTPIKSEAEGDFYDNYVTSRKAALRALSNRFKTLERKILRLEDAVTSREFDWDEKL